MIAFFSFCFSLNPSPSFFYGFGREHWALLFSGWFEPDTTMFTQSNSVCGLVFALNCFVSYSIFSECVSVCLLWCVSLVVCFDACALTCNWANVVVMCFLAWGWYPPIHVTSNSELCWYFVGASGGKAKNILYLYTRLTEINTEVHYSS